MKYSKEFLELMIGDGKYKGIKVEYKPWWFFLPFKSWRRWFANREMARHE